MAGFDLDDDFLGLVGVVVDDADDAVHAAVGAFLALFGSRFAAGGPSLDKG